MFDKIKDKIEAKYGFENPNIRTKYNDEQKLWEFTCKGVYIRITADNYVRCYVFLYVTDTYNNSPKTMWYRDEKKDNTAKSMGFKQAMKCINKYFGL